MRRLVVTLLLLAGLIASISAWAEEPLRLGVLSFRAKEKTLAQWTPLAQYLQANLKQRIEVAAYDFDELAGAINENRVDVVFTNPGNYTQLHHRNGVSAPLVTVITVERGNKLSAFGGVIFTKAGRQGVENLHDLAGKRIAVTQTDSFGGYQAQVFEMLEAGLELPVQDTLVMVGMPHDGVVMAVMDGRADVGFVRTGVLEALVDEGRIAPGSFKVVNRQDLSAYPNAASTRLYPEWPLAVMPTVDEDTARHLAVALLSLPADSVAAKVGGIHGFAVPADYSGVERLLRKLRQPPFDVAPEFTLQDFARKYAIWLGGLTALLASLAGLGVWVVVQNSRLHIAQTRLDLATQGSGLGIWDLDVRNRANYFSPRTYEMLGYVPGEFPATFQAWQQICHPQDLPGVLATIDDADKRRLVGYMLTMRLRAKDGRWRWIESRSQVQRDSAGRALRRIGTHLDITERKQAEESLQRSANVFTFAREGILITDADGTIVEVNEAFSRITGYAREEAIGQNPRILKSGRQPSEFYAGMWQALKDVGHWSGEVWNRKRDGSVYAEMLTVSAVHDADGRVRNYVSLFTDITPIKENQELLENIAHYDTLTALPNRVLLADRLQQAMAQSQRRGLSLAVVFLDLDGFKIVNDTHGHDVGDELLIALAVRMKTALREGDTLARIGGDEFIAVLVDLEQPQDCEPVLDRILQAASAPVTLTAASGDLLLQVSASLGITLYPQDGADADQLMRHADQAMYQAKQAGKNRYRMFDVALNAAVQSHHETMMGIRRALERREFVLYYQPKVNMRTGAVVGAEALIRWQHPGKGLLAPGLFLPGVEHDTVGLALGEWVIETALQQMAAWSGMGLHMPVSVNVGAYQLQHPGFVQRLGELLAAQPGAKAQDLELEVLETSAMQDMSRVADAMRDCQAMGVRFALDDFGTGYSSLTYLRRLHAETLKIDQSFVRDMLVDAEDLEIVNGVIGLARSFGRNVIAEGVETLAHGERLMDLGCDLAQGYGIARPMPAQQFPGWAASWQRRPTWLHL